MFNCITMCNFVQRKYTENMSWNKNLTGIRFGRLVAISQLYRNKNLKYVWLCRCDCGNMKEVVDASLKNGDIKSCGCLAIEAVSKHNKSNTKEYRVWADMIQRCTNPKSNNYKFYGAKGISVCDIWVKSFEEFYKDMGPKPGVNFSIDRIDCAGNYNKSNCRWATREEQDANRTSSRIIEYNGNKYHLLKWARVLNITYQSLRGYLKTHTFEEAFIHYTKKPCNTSFVNVPAKKEANAGTVQSGNQRSLVKIKNKQYDTINRISRTAKNTRQRYSYEY